MSQVDLFRAARVFGHRLVEYELDPGTGLFAVRSCREDDFFDSAEELYPKIGTLSHNG